MSIKQHTEHAENQLPTENTIAKNLLDGIKRMDAILLEAINMARKDEDNIIKNFKATSAHLLPRFHMTAHKNTSDKDDRVTMPGTEVNASSTAGSANTSVGNTGVEFFYCKEAEFKKLSTTQKQELI